MTKYNEKLDEVLNKLLPAYERDTYNGDVAISEAKQAILNWVAEAKPNDYVPEGHQPEACLNHEKYTSACCGCQRQSARLHALDEFEQNLLKALEEVE